MVPEKSPSAGLAKPVESSPVGEALKLNSVAASRLRDIVDTLSDRLSPALSTHDRPELKEPKVQAQDVSNCDIVIALENTAMSVRASIEAIEFLTSRLQI